MGAEVRWGHTGKEDSTLSRSHQWMMAVQDPNERQVRETTPWGWEERDPNRMGKAGQRSWAAGLQNNQPDWSKKS